MIRIILLLFFCPVLLFCSIPSINAQDHKVSENKNMEINFISGDITYYFKSDRFIDFTHKGNIVFPDSTDAVLMEIRGDKKIEAELKVNRDDYRLIFIHEGCLDEYYKSEEDWMANFFKNIIKFQKNPKVSDATEINSGSSSSVLDTVTENAFIDVFLNTLKSIILEKDRAELLGVRIKKGSDIKEQKKIIGFIFSNFQVEQNKMELLGLMLDHPSWSKENNEFVMAFIDQLTIESNKVLILKKLLK